jgi:hypothetical protein
MRASATVLVFLVTACSEGTGPGNCSDVQVSISPGTTPQFSWTGACPAYSLQVSGPSISMWYVSGGEVLDDVIQPPVQYGTVPVGSVQNAPAAPLESGTEYTVRLDRRNRFGGGVTFLAERTFTP